jgi:hypothetical protein
MTDDRAPKSAFEIAMERLRQKDAAEGVEHRPISDRQKSEIAEVRSVYAAKLAQEEVMHASNMARLADPLARAEREAEYQRERERLTSERDAKIERIRRS